MWPVFLSLWQTYLQYSDLSSPPFSYCFNLYPFLFVLFMCFWGLQIFSMALSQEEQRPHPPSALLDSIGDIVFSATSFIAIYPLLHFDLFLLFLIALIFILRVINKATGLMKEKILILLHTVPNKVTGLLLFIFPLTLNLIPYALSSTVIAVAALYASIDEGILIWKGRIK